jgi:hypothetical protein
MILGMLGRMLLPSTAAVGSNYVAGETGAYGNDPK